MAAAPGADARQLNVRIEPAGIDLKVDSGELLMHAATSQGYRWPTLCHGEGTCTICFIEVLENPGGLVPIQQAEREAIEFCKVAERCDGEVRLACQARVVEDLTVRKKGVRLAQAAAQRDEANTAAG